MSTPQQPNGRQPYGNEPNGQQPNERIVYVEKKKKGGCMKWGLIILAVLVVLGIIAALTSGGEDSDTSSSSGDTSNSATDNGQTEEEAPADDTLAMGETFTTGSGVDIVASSLRTSDNGFGTSLVCSDVTYTNNGEETADFQGYWDWKIQNPAGVITDPTFSSAEDTLDSGSLAPGGTVSGAVCFEGAEPGEHRLIFEPTLSFSRDTATWVGSI